MDMPIFHTATAEAPLRRRETGRGARHLQLVPAAGTGPALVIDRFDSWGDGGRAAMYPCHATYPSCVDVTDELEAAA